MAYIMPCTIYFIRTEVTGSGNSDMVAHARVASKMVAHARLCVSLVFVPLKVSPEGQPPLWHTVCPVRYIHKHRSDGGREFKHGRARTGCEQDGRACTTLLVARVRPADGLLRRSPPLWYSLCLISDTFQQHTDDKGEDWW
jgi:hypothetical protein